MTPVPDSRIAHASPPARRAFATTGKEWFTIIILSIIAIFFCLIIFWIIAPSPTKIHDRAVMDALFRCQNAIKLTAQYGGAEMPPYAKNYGRGDEFYFAWPRGSFEFANAFGSREKMSASCTGVISTGEIQQLTVNAKDVL